MQPEYDGREMQAQHSSAYDRVNETGFTNKLMNQQSYPSQPGTGFSYQPEGQFAGGSQQLPEGGVHRQTPDYGYYYPKQSESSYRGDEGEGESEYPGPGSSAGKHNTSRFAFSNDRGDAPNGVHHQASKDRPYNHNDAAGGSTF